MHVLTHPTVFRYSPTEYIILLWSQLILTIPGAHPPIAGIPCSHSCWQSWSQFALPCHWRSCPQIARWHGNSLLYSILWNCSTTQPILIRKGLKIFSAPPLSLSLSSVYTAFIHPLKNHIIITSLPVWVPLPAWEPGPAQCGRGVWSPVSGQSASPWISSQSALHLEHSEGTCSCEGRSYCKPSELSSRSSYLLVPFTSTKNHVSELRGCPF